MFLVCWTSARPCTAWVLRRLACVQRYDPSWECGHCALGYPVRTGRLRSVDTSTEDGRNTRRPCIALYQMCYQFPVLSSRFLFQA